MALTVLHKITKAKIGALVLDASLQENHTGDVEVTDHPVEQGANISDHARPRPLSVTIEGLVSNTPISKEERDALGEQPRGAAGPAEAAFQTLEQIRTGGQLVTIVTKLKTYANMVMTSLHIPKNAGIGDALQFSATFREIKTVQSQSVPVTNTKLQSAKPKTRKGKQQPKPAAQPAKLRSSLKKFTDFLGATTPGSGVIP